MTAGVGDGEFFTSYGGGVQSTAMLVLARQGYLRGYTTFLFANTGDDSEDPETLRYVREVAFDYAAAGGIRIEELGPARGQSLRQRMMDPTAVGLREPIPFRGENGAPFKRSCTAEWKIGVVGEWLQKHAGATAASPVDVAVGISVDELERANARTARPYERLHYPLLHIEWRGGIGLTRSQCQQVIREAGLPVPPKSSCYFCPFHRPSTWQHMAVARPELFEQACQLEDHANARRADLGKSQRVFLTRFGRPLRDAVNDHQGHLFTDPAWDEDEGYRCGDVCDT